MNEPVTASGTCSLVLLLLAATPAMGAPSADDSAPADGALAPPCSGPESGRPPDPRCGESLDGRSATPRTPPLTVARTLLWVPRGISWAVFWPLVRAGDFVEYHHVPGWIAAFLTTDDRLIGIRPELSYSTSLVSTAGARVYDRRLPGRGSELSARFLTAGAPVLFGQLAWRGPDWLGLSLAASFDRRQDRLFAGIGPNSVADLAAAGRTPARYASDIWKAELGWARREHGWLVLQAHGDVQRRDYQSAAVHSGPSVASVFGLAPDQCAAAGLSSPCVDEGVLPRFTQGLRIAHAGAGLTIDPRDHGRDGSGVTAAVDVTLGQGLAGDPSRDTRLSAELVAALGGVDRVLLLRGRAALVEALGAAPIPFDELISPSGSFGMRGFLDGRFRGESGLLATAEYRYYIGASLDASLFTDLGTVAGPRFSGLRADRWFPDFGVGFRLFWNDAAQWDAIARTGVQFIYAPDAGFRVLLGLAGF